MQRFFRNVTKMSKINLFLKMINTEFDIIPKYKFKTYFGSILLIIGFFLIIISFLFKNFDGYRFLGFLLIIIGGAFIIFTSKRYLRFTEKSIEFESKSIIKDFCKSISIEFDNIEEVLFLKRQFLILGARNPIADADAQTLYHENRIAFKLKNGKIEIIPQTGKIRGFKNAFNFVKSKTKITDDTV